jgi:MFS family permease
VARLTKRCIAEALAVSLGGFVFGYDLGAISSATQSLRSHFELSPANYGMTISFSLWGTVCGSLLAGRWADRLGRRALIAGCAMLYLLAATCMTLPLPSGWFFLLAMRFLCGIAIGGFTVGCPLYLAELASSGHRGRLVGLFQLQVGAGVVVAFGAGSLFARLDPQGAVWRWCLGAGAAPALVLLLAIGHVSGREAGSVEGLSGTGNRVVSVSDITKKPLNDSQRLFRRRNLRPILLATSIAIFNQLSGVNIVLLYMLDILSSAGIALDTGHTYTVLISCLSLGTTALGMAYVDKAGRKPLLYIGSAGMATCLFCLAVSIPHHFVPVTYLCILVAYNAFFAFSQGAVVWVYLSELFPVGIRGAGQGYGSSVHWIMNATLVFAFPTMQHASSVRLFYLFALMMIVQIGAVWRWYPETRGAALGSLPAAGVHNKVNSTCVP